MESSIRSPIFLCLIGPAGAGKSSIAEKLISSHLTVQSSSLQLSISATSRKARANEKEGVHYYFFSRDEFEKKVSEGQFFEWEETHGNLYGTLKSTLNDAISGRYDLLFDVDIRGALTLKKSFPEHAVVVLVVPPSPEELRMRMEARGSATEPEIKRRLDTASGEYDMAKAQKNKIDYLVINDTFEAAYNEVVSILLTERARLSRVDDKAFNSLVRV